jgi:hypothetical protein
MKAQQKRFLLLEEFYKNTAYQGDDDIQGIPYVPPDTNDEYDDSGVIPMVDRNAGRQIARVRKYDVSSLATKPGKNDNWLESSGETLDPFIRAIAHALIRDGMPRSQAIAIAIGTVKRWARGGGNVSAKTRAKAIKAVARWEKSKLKAKAKRNR